MRRTRGPATYAFPAGLAALALAAAGCGADDNPKNPRPAKPIEITAKVDDEKVAVSPSEFGAGLTVFTVSNQTEDEVQLILEGPQDFSSNAIAPQGVDDSFKVPLEEGEYEVSAGEESDAKSAQLVVGPERPSSQDELLLP